mmetsp:Transcript_67043/g.216162  ORF Transcript_67043/g.216162 Transcript_67043/m.216162 type:complete len:273 (-) Transcript_67043:1262-2080(-)
MTRRLARGLRKVARSPRVFHGLAAPQPRDGVYELLVHILRPGQLRVEVQGHESKGDTHEGHEGEGEHQDPDHAVILRDAALLVDVVADEGDPIRYVLPACERVGAKAVRRRAPVEEVAILVCGDRPIVEDHVRRAAALSVFKRPGISEIRHHDEGEALAWDHHELRDKLHGHDVACLTAPAAAEELIVVHTVADQVLQQEAAAVGAAEQASHQQGDVAHRAVARVTLQEDEGAGRECQGNIEEKVGVVLAGLCREPLPEQHAGGATDDVRNH